MQKHRPKYAATEDARQSSGVCQYPAKARRNCAMKQGGTADGESCSSLTMKTVGFLSGAFFVFDREHGGAYVHFGKAMA